MRFKGVDGTTFATKIKDGVLHITAYYGRKKGGTWQVKIKEYLSCDTEYSRRQHLFNQDVHDVKTECHLAPAARNLDAIHKSVTHELKEAGEFKPAFADVMRGHS